MTRFGTFLVLALAAAASAGDGTCAAGDGACADGSAMGGLEAELRAHFATQDAAGARAVLRRMSALQPRHLDHYYHIAGFSRQLQELGAAAAALRAAAAAEPRAAAPHFMLAELAAATDGAATAADNIGDIVSHLRAAAAAPGLGASPARDAAERRRATAALGARLLEAGDVEGAAAQLAATVTSYQKHRLPTHPAALTSLAEARAKQNRGAEALALLRRVPAAAKAWGTAEDGEQARTEARQWAYRAAVALALELFSQRQLESAAAAAADVRKTFGEGGGADVAAQVLLIEAHVADAQGGVAAATALYAAAVAAARRMQQSELGPPLPLFYQVTH